MTGYIIHIMRDENYNAMREVRQVLSDVENESEPGIPQESSCGNSISQSWEQQVNSDSWNTDEVRHFICGNPNHALPSNQL